MSEQILDILDRSLKYSLWAFLVVFVFILFFVSLRLRARKKGLADYFREMEKQFERKIVGEEVTRTIAREIPLSDRLRMAFHALLLASLLAVISFLITGFTPLPFFDNFASVRTWEIAPLRLASLSYERFQDGFSLDGEVWNQSRQPVGQLRAVIRIWKSDRELLDQITVPVVPESLAPDSAGTFNARYTADSPFLYGYQVLFETEGGVEIPHVKGFDVY